MTGKIVSHPFLQIIQPWYRPIHIAFFTSGGSTSILTSDVWVYNLLPMENKWSGENCSHDIWHYYRTSQRWDLVTGFKEFL